MFHASPAVERARIMALHRAPDLDVFDDGGRRCLSASYGIRRFFEIQGRAFPRGSRLLAVLSLCGHGSPIKLPFRIKRPDRLTTARPRVASIKLCALRVVFELECVGIGRVPAIELRQTRAQRPGLLRPAERCPTKLE